MTIYAICTACGGYLDRDDSVCRACGADNDPRADDPSESLDLTAIDLDRLHPWSKVKHTIIEKYAGAYTTILRTQQWAKRYVYLDAFAGAGVAIDAESDELIAAGALRALEVVPPFSEYHFIEQDPMKVEVLRRLTRRRPEATVHRGDYRAILPIVLERCRWGDHVRGLCLLDPYGLSVDYALLQQIASMGTVEVFFNFMIVAANRNVLWNVNPNDIPPARAAIMTRVWGNENWREELYEQKTGLFGHEYTKVTNERVIAAYRKRLKAAGFSYVPEPIAMKNSMNAAVYYLFFCSPKAVAASIVSQVFDTYR